MKRILLILFLSINLFAFDNIKVENLMGEEKFQTYNKLLDKIFVDNNNSIKNIVIKLKNNGLLDLFFDEAKLIKIKFIFEGNENILNNKILNDTLISLGYYYFYPIKIVKNGDKFELDIEFKSEHYIDPVSFINEVESRGCKVLDIYKKDDIYNYKLNCNKINIKKSKELTSDNNSYIDANGIYWLTNNDFEKLSINTKRIDYWHPSVWFYDDKLNLLNNIKINKKTINLTLKIPAGCKYIKITDIYSAENFKRGIIVKGLK